ncbi:MAG TPA: type II toxin-antitoxin system VapC family toxin [Thermomicrobiaceae bacterium]|nr:type II toxin-antitoxin system VapC family toxin [Thermomicrobiaceae bacterium]
MILFDANVLVYAINEDAPQHSASATVVQAAIDGRLSGVVVPQVLLEFFAVVTHPRRVEHPLAPAAAWRQVMILRTALPVLEPGAGVLTSLGQLVTVHQPSGGSIFDLHLAAQMQAHGIATICTYNRSDFAHLAGIAAVTPDDLLAGLA